MSRVLVIGDIHAPVDHPAYLDFCRDVAEEWDCDRTAFIGDIVDWHSISFHARHPDAPGPADEYELSLAQVAKWYNAFPEADVAIGNHDERLLRLAATVGISAAFMRDYSDVWNTSGWNWAHEFYIDDVYYFHGTGRGGMHPAYNVAKDMGCSVVMGHVHSAGGVKYQMSPTHRRFGMDVGCGVDDKLYAFAYNRHNKRRSALGCGVVLDGIAFWIPMECGPGEPYHRDNYPPSPLMRGA